MKTKKATAVLATAIVLALSASACGGSDSKDDKKSNGAGIDAGLTSIVNKSDKKGHRHP